MNPRPIRRCAAQPGTPLLRTVLLADMVDSTAWSNASATVPPRLFRAHERLVLQICSSTGAAA